MSARNVFPPYEEVKGQIEQGMQSQVQQKAINDIRAKTKIESPRDSRRLHFLRAF